MENRGSSQEKIALKGSFILQKQFNHIPKDININMNKINFTFLTKIFKTQGTKENCLNYQRQKKIISHMKSLEIPKYQHFDWAFSTGNK